MREELLVKEPQTAGLIQEEDELHTDAELDLRAAGGSSESKPH